MGKMKRKKKKKERKKERTQEITYVCTCMSAYTYKNVYFFFFFSELKTLSHKKCDCVWGGENGGRELIIFLVNSMEKQIVVVRHGCVQHKKVAK